MSAPLSPGALERKRKAILAELLPDRWARQDSANADGPGQAAAAAPRSGQALSVAARSSDDDGPKARSCMPTITLLIMLPCALDAGSAARGLRFSRIIDAWAHFRAGRSAVAGAGGGPRADRRAGAPGSRPRRAREGALATRRGGRSRVGAAAIREGPAQVQPGPYRLGGQGTLRWLSRASSPCPSFVAGPRRASCRPLLRRRTSTRQPRRSPFARRLRC